MTQPYRTADLYEAAALYATGERLVDIDTAKKPYGFIFEDATVGKIKSLEYANNELAGLLKDYADAVKLLKAKVNTL